MCLRRLHLILILTLGIFCARAQVLSRQVSLHVQNQSLESTLAQLERDYSLSFVYSRSFVPVDQRVSCSQSGVPLRMVMQDILRGTQVVAVEKRGVVILKPDSFNKEELLSKQESVPDPPFLLDTEALSDEQLERSLRERQERLASLPLIEQKRFESLPGGSRVQVPSIDKYRREWQLTAAPEKITEANIRKAQVSLLPMLGTNFTSSDELTNKVSLNLLWGINGGVDGVEIGGIVNTIYEDVKGVQVAGLANTVAGSVEGAQVAGIFNLNKGDNSGVQIAGLFNINGSSSAIQVAGLFNLVKGKTSGIQASLLFNKANEGEDLTQATGIFNKNRGDARVQASIFYNRARNVKTGQFSLFYNKAREVRGIQFGLINVADTVSGVPIGLFNIIRKGYNRIELGASETFWTNAGLKFGAKRFYNIVHLGMRWDDVGPEKPVETPVSWTLGYGIGTMFDLSASWGLNVEGIIQHVNEQEGWTNRLNLMTRFRVTADRKVGKRISFFVGPHVSILASDRIDPETGTYQSLLVPYTIFQETTNGRTVSMWIGFSGGLRF